MYVLILEIYNLPLGYELTGIIYDKDFTQRGLMLYHLP